MPHKCNLAFSNIIIVLALIAIGQSRDFSSFQEFNMSVLNSCVGEGGGRMGTEKTFKITRRFLMRFNGLGRRRVRRFTLSRSPPGSPPPRGAQAFT
jgi:hypothetical protein